HAMRKSICLLCLFALGCGSSAPPDASPPASERPIGPPIGTRAAPPRRNASQSASASAPEMPVPSAVAKPDDPLPPDLPTHTAGSDWPCFLGPAGNSVASEKGLTVPWPKEGPRVVWQRGLRESYAMPSISRGRLFLFDRVDDKNRLYCLKSET